MHVYWFRDSKIGHIKQVQALLDEMKKEMPFSLSCIECSANTLMNWLKPVNKKIKSHNGENEIILLIGAGHATYQEILKSKKTIKNNKVIAIAVLKPSINLKSFDLICAPEHDFKDPKGLENIITFKGSLALTSMIEPGTNKAIISIGGHSKHYKFNNEIALKQITYILTTYPNHYFSIFNSRRTPKLLNKKIKQLLNFHNHFKFIDFKDHLSGNFQSELQTSSIKFATPDSVNLVFESLSCKGKTYLIQIEAPGYKPLLGTTKIRQAMSDLVTSQQVGIVRMRVDSESKINIQDIHQPSPHFEPMAEVKKISYSIISLIKEKT